MTPTTPYRDSRVRSQSSEPTHPDYPSQHQLNTSNSLSLGVGVPRTENHDRNQHQHQYRLHRRRGTEVIPPNRRMPKLLCAYGELWDVVKGTAAAENATILSVIPFATNTTPDSSAMTCSLLIRRRSWTSTARTLVVRERRNMVPNSWR